MAGALAMPFAQATYIEEFDNLDNWNILNSGGGSLAPSANGSLTLAAEAYSPTTDRIMRVVTKTGYGDLNFAGGNAVDLSFKNLSIQSTVATPTILIGLTTDPNNVNIYNRTNALYFQQNGTGNALLVLRNNNIATTLWASTSSSQLRTNYSALDIHLTDENWALRLYDNTGSELVSVSGELDSLSHWTTNPHLSIAAMQSSSNGSATINFTLDGINPIPEARTTILAMALITAIAVPFLRSRSTKR